MIKMTCAVNWIIVRERRAESTSLSRPDLANSRGKTVSRHLELSLDAVDDIYLNKRAMIALYHSPEYHSTQGEYDLIRGTFLLNYFERP